MWIGEKYRSIECYAGGDGIGRWRTDDDGYVSFNMASCAPQEGSVNMDDGEEQRLTRCSNDRKLRHDPL